jgi:hypothetical protein
MNLDGYVGRLHRVMEAFALRHMTPLRVAKLDPLKPSRADYRLVRKLLESSYSGQVDHTQKGYDLIIQVFAKAGGSWERLFMGSSKDVSLLKKVIRVAFSKGYLPKSTQWR